MKLSNFLAFIVVAGLSAAIGYFVGTDMKGFPGQDSGAMKAEVADPNDKVVATVDGQEIRESFVLAMYEKLPAQYKQSPYAFVKAQLVEQLVNMRIIQNAAMAEKYDAQPEYLERVVDVELQLLQEYYLKKKLDDAITDEALKSEYDKATAEFKPEEEAHARHILLKEEQEAKDVIAKLDAGDDFVALAKELSTGPSGPSGGDLGYFTKARMVPEFSEAAFKLEKGKYTAVPVKTQFGWHVIKLEDLRDTQPPAFEEMKQQLGDTLRNTTVTALIEKLKSTAQIIIAPPEEKPAAAEDAKKSDN